MCGERFLASFAILGVKAGQRNTSEKEFAAALESRCESTSDEFFETRQIKAMVEGMKNEARRYTAAGGGVTAGLILHSLYHSLDLPRFEKLIRSGFAS